MGDVEKARTSGEQQRPELVLPTVNPATEKSEPPKAALHPAVYVMYGYRLSIAAAKLTITQNMDKFQRRHNPV